MKTVAVLLLSTLAANARAAETESLRFIACPIYRDTDAGRKSGCWLADDPTSGRRLDISAAPTKPDWNYEVLVEGTVAARQVDNCGGLVLEPVRVSVLPGRCARHMLPAEGYAGNKYSAPGSQRTPLIRASSAAGAAVQHPAVPFVVRLRQSVRRLSAR